MARRSTHRETQGRYGSASNTTDPGNLPREGRCGKQEIRHGFVDDHNPAFRGQQQKAAINVKTDALETEYAHRRISEDAYRAGRIYQRVLEVSGGRPTGGGQWMEGDRVDAASAHETAIWRNIDTARKAQDMIFDVLPVIGLFGANVLRLTLLDRLTISKAAAQCEGSSGRMGVIFYAETFRRSLQAVADHWARTIAPGR